MNKLAQSSAITNPAVPWATTDPGAAIGNLLSASMALLIVIGVVVFMYNIILGGIDYINAGGDKTRIESARQKIFNALVGITILFAFFAILNLVECFFGIGLRAAAIGPFSITFVSNAVCQ